MAMKSILRQSRKSRHWPTTMRISMIPKNGNGYMLPLAGWRYTGLRLSRAYAIKLQNNDDERVEVKCEHYSIYKQMADRGYDKVYINPQMKLKYQSLSMKIIINHILRLWDRRVDRQTKKYPHTSRQHKIVFMPHCYGGNHELKAA